MKRYIKVFITIFLLVVFCFPSVSFANNSGGGVSGGGDGACADCSWHYDDANDFGIRLSLYKYDGVNLQYYGSVNYCASGSNSANCFSKQARQTKSKAGKVAYQQGKTLYSVNDWDTKASVISKNTTVVFPNLFTASWSMFESKVKELFSLNSANATEVLKKIQKEFSPNAKNLTVSDLDQIYITIEPSLLLGAESVNYYGTAYELAAWMKTRGSARTADLTEVMYQKLPQSIIAQYVVLKKDKYSFIGNLVKLTEGKNELSRSIWGNSETNQKNREANVNDILSLKGYAINVFWLGNYVPAVPTCTITESSDAKTYTMNVTNPNGETIYYDINNNVNLLRHNVKNNTYSASYKDQRVVGEVYNSKGNKIASCALTRSIKTCSETCSGKSGDSLLGCAEEYCQGMSDNTSEKKTCITTCGYSDPGFSSCSSNSSSNGSNTVCDQDTTASKTTCTVANTSNYYKTVCTEKSTITYSNSLPVTLIPGAGFSYTPTVSGSKTCEMTFDVNKWKFDYAVAYTSEQRNRLLGILNQYNNVSGTSIWAQDLNNIYKYDSSNADIEIEVTDSNDLTESNRKTTKKLVINKTTNLLSEEVKISSAGTSNVSMFANGGTTNKIIFRIIRTTSSNETNYKLPGTCMNIGDGTLYDLGPNGSCNSKNDGPYYKYYTNLKIEEDDYDTKTTVKKSSSALDVNNTCNYKVVDNVPSSSSPLSCSISVTDCTSSGVKERAELRIQNSGGLKISYGLSSTGYVINNSKTINITSSMKKLYGAISVDGKIVEVCSLDLTVATCPNSSGGNNTCTYLYKPSSYSEIRNYCSISWMDDTANYASEDDCFNSCSYGANTCKNNPDVDTSNRLSVTTFCSDKTNREVNGYNRANYGNANLNEQHDIAMCVNDCYEIDTIDKDGTSNCLGIVCDYLYRPISLKDPFPNNRNSGYNWYGKEIFITDDLLNPLLSEGAEAEYVIELTPEVIDMINKNTDQYNSGKNKNAYIDYVYNDNSSKDGKYISKFIHSNDIENGGFGMYFTKTLN